MRLGKVSKLSFKIACGRLDFIIRVSRETRRERTKRVCHVAAAPPDHRVRVGGPVTGSAVRNHVIRNFFFAVARVLHETTRDGPRMSLLIC